MTKSSSRPESLSQSICEKAFLPAVCKFGQNKGCQTVSDGIYRGFSSLLAQQSKGSLPLASHLRRPVPSGTSNAGVAQSGSVWPQYVLYPQQRLLQLLRTSLNSALSFERIRLFFLSNIQLPSVRGSVQCTLRSVWSLVWFERKNLNKSFDLKCLDLKWFDQKFDLIKKKMENGVDQVALVEGVKNVHISSSGRPLERTFCQSFSKCSLWWQ